MSVRHDDMMAPCLLFSLHERAHALAPRSVCRPQPEHLRYLDIVKSVLISGSGGLGELRRCAEARLVHRSRKSIEEPRLPVCMRNDDTHDKRHTETQGKYTWVAHTAADAGSASFPRCSPSPCATSEDGEGRYPRPCIARCVAAAHQSSGVDHRPAPAAPPTVGHGRCSGCRERTLLGRRQVQCR
jgi:hypothetical protein